MSDPPVDSGGDEPTPARRAKPSIAEVAAWLRQAAEEREPTDDPSVRQTTEPAGDGGPASPEVGTTGHDLPPVEGFPGGGVEAGGTDTWAAPPGHEAGTDTAGADLGVGAPTSGPSLSPDFDVHGPARTDPSGRSLAGSHADPELVGGDPGGADVDASRPGPGEWVDPDAVEPVLGSAGLGTTGPASTELTGSDLPGRDLTGPAAAETGFSGTDGRTFPDGVHPQGAGPASLHDPDPIGGEGDPTPAGPLGTDVAGTDLPGTDHTGTDLTGTDLPRTEVGTDLPGTGPSGTGPSGTDATGADLGGADGADRFGTDLSGRDLFDSGHSGGRHSSRDLSGTIPSGTDLAGPQLGDINRGGTDPDWWDADPARAGAEAVAADPAESSPASPALAGTAPASPDLPSTDLPSTDTGTDIADGGTAGTDAADPGLPDDHLTGFADAPTAGNSLRDIDTADPDVAASDVTGSDVIGTDLYGTDLYGTDLYGTDLYGTGRTSTYLTDRGPSDAGLTDRGPSDTGPIDTDRTGTDLTDSELTDSELTSTDLTGTDRTGTDTAYANLTGTGLTGTDTAGTSTSAGIGIDSDLAGTDLAGTDLAGTDLAGTELAGTGLAGTDTGTDLTGTGHDSRRTGLDGDDARVTSLGHPTGTDPVDADLLPGAVDEQDLAGRDQASTMLDSTDRADVDRDDTDGLGTEWGAADRALTNTASTDWNPTSDARSTDRDGIDGPSVLLAAGVAPAEAEAAEAGPTPGDEHEVEASAGQIQTGPPEESGQLLGLDSPGTVQESGTDDVGAAGGGRPMTLQERLDRGPPYLSSTPRDRTVPTRSEGGKDVDGLGSTDLWAKPEVEGDVAGTGDEDPGRPDTGTIPDDAPVPEGTPTGLASTAGSASSLLDLDLSTLATPDRTSDGQAAPEAPFDLDLDAEDDDAKDRDRWGEPVVTSPTGRTDTDPGSPVDDDADPGGSVAGVAAVAGGTTLERVRERSPGDDGVVAGDVEMDHDGAVVEPTPQTSLATAVSDLRRRRAAKRKRYPRGQLKERIGFLRRVRAMLGIVVLTVVLGVAAGTAIGAFFLFVAYAIRSAITSS